MVPATVLPQVETLPQVGGEDNKTSIPPGSGAVPAPPEVQTIDLEHALALARTVNPSIALAQEEVEASRAENTAARALLLPTVQAGVNLNVHRGTLESAQSIIRDVDRQVLYVGAGARAIGAGTVTIPGVRITAHLADAVFAPQITGQRVISSEFAAVATQNDILLEVALRYYALVGAEARLEAIHRSERELAEVVELLSNLARTGQGREGDADRARSEAHLLHLQAQGVEEAVAVAAAELTQLLNVDPAVRLRSPGGDVPVMELVDPREALESLLQLALRNRPEISSQAAEVALQQARLRQEQVRPFVPFVTAGFSAGRFGGGSDQVDSRFGNFGNRTDFDVLAVWSIRNLGLGNHALQERRRAEVSLAAAELLRETDRVRREVAEAHALSAARRQEVETARRRMASAERAYRQDLARSKSLTGRPIEVLNSISLLTNARQDLIRAETEYAQAQFQLFVALGQPPFLALPGSHPCP